MDKENEGAIPVLFQKEINQRLFKREDYQLQVDLGPIQFQMKRNKDEKFVIIKVLHIKPTQLILSYDKKPKNRLMAILGKEIEEKFLYVSFDMYNTQRNYAKQCLSAPITINKDRYNFFGYSKANLKQFSCYFYKGSQLEIVNLLNSFGNFDQIYQISKKAARLSLLYSESNFVCRLENQQIKMIQDVEKQGVCFSDGCGYISRRLARKIKKHVDENEKNNNKLEYLPSVYQIRVKGIKGIVVLNPIYDDQQMIAVRKSMVKFIAKEDKLNEFVLINYSKPAQEAAINQQIIMLLSGMGVHSQYLLELQKSYLEMLKNALKDPLNNVEMLKFLGKQDIIIDIIEKKINMEFRIKSVISEQIHKNIKTKDLKNRLKIPLSKARFLYGAVCPQLQGVNDKKTYLKENQIFLRVTTYKNEVKTIIGKVMVTKNPCYYCGDIRILEAVDIGQQIPFFNKLVDVIVFSTEGEIPVCTTISGSDYDGDQYFVCWDQNLIPKKQIKPYTYPMTAAKKKKQKVTQNDLINYFINFDRTIVGKINNRFLGFANISHKGVRCDQCVQLGTKIFSRAIDSVNTGQKVYIPDHLKNPGHELKENQVWIKMTRQYENFFQNQFKFDDQLISSWDITYEMMVQLIQTFVSSQSYNDYQLFKIIKSWYIAKKYNKYDLFQYVDFSQLTVEQKREIKDLPNFPKEYFGNPFEYSPIFNHQLFKKHDIDFHTYEERPKKWRSYYKTKGDFINFEYIQQALSKFNNFLLGIKVNQNVRLIFCLRNTKTLAYTQNYLPDQALTVYYVGNNQLKRFNNRSSQKQTTYKLYYSDELFQIYQKQRANSFFWFRNNQVSIDLTRFDRTMLNRHLKITKEVIKHVEVYIGVSENYRQSQPIKKMEVGEYRKASMSSSQRSVQKESKIQKQKKHRYKQKQEPYNKKEKQGKKKYQQKKQQPDKVQKQRKRYIQKK